MPPRKKNKAQVHTSASNDSSSKETASGTAARPKAVRGRRGGLKDMPNMPLDVLLEIFGFMHPRDLLSLARTSQSFRAFLMSKNTQSLWKAAIDSVDGLPECPSYMSEPVYVNLLFFNHCHNCLKNNVRVVLFQCCTRYCPACRKIMFVRENEYSRLFRELLSDTGSVPTWFYAHAITGNVLLHKPQVDEFQARWDALVHVAAKKDLVLEYENKTKLIQEASQKYYSWESHQKARRADELDDIRAGRLEAIRDRLREAGWQKELDFIDSTPYHRYNLERQKFATRSEPLTDRVWQKIQKDVIAFVKGVQTQRLWNEHKVLLHDRFAAFGKAFWRYQGWENGKRSPKSDLGPQLQDLLLIPEVRKLLDRPNSEDMSFLDDPDKMQTVFDTSITKWDEDRQNDLCDVFQDSFDGRADLSLAHVWFRCLHCRRRNLKYPEVLAHGCQRKVSWAWIIGWDTGQVNDVYKHAVATYKRCHLPQWRGLDGSLKVSTEALIFLPPILEACGLDPRTATRHDADGCGARLICRTCHRSPAEGDSDSVVRRKMYTVFDWSGAVDHCIGQGKQWFSAGPLGVIDHQWERTSEEEAEAVRKLEDELRNRDDLLHRNWYRHNCAYCEYVGTREGMSEHLSKHHDREVPVAEVDDHCYLAGDSTLKLPQIVVKRGDDGAFQVEHHENDVEIEEIVYSDSDSDPFAWSSDED